MLVVRRTEEESRIVPQKTVLRNKKHQDQKENTADLVMLVTNALSMLAWNWVQATAWQIGSLADCANPSRPFPRQFQFFAHAGPWMQDWMTAVLRARSTYFLPSSRGERPYRMPARIKATGAPAPKLQRVKIRHNLLGLYNEHGFPRSHRAFSDKKSTPSPAEVLICAALSPSSAHPVNVYVEVVHIDNCVVWLILKTDNCRFRIAFSHIQNENEAGNQVSICFVDLVYMSEQQQYVAQWKSKKEDAHWKIVVRREKGPTILHIKTNRFDKQKKDCEYDSRPNAETVLVRSRNKQDQCIQKQKLMSMMQDLEERQKSTNSPKAHENIMNLLHYNHRVCLPWSLLFPLRLTVVTKGSWQLVSDNFAHTWLILQSLQEQSKKMVLFVWQLGSDTPPMDGSFEFALRRTKAYSNRGACKFLRQGRWTWSHVIHFWKYGMTSTQYHELWRDWCELAAESSRIHHSPLHNGSRTLLPEFNIFTQTALMIGTGDRGMARMCTAWSVEVHSYSGTTSLFRTEVREITSGKRMLRWNMFPDGSHVVHEIDVASGMFDEKTGMMVAWKGLIGQDKQPVLARLLIPKDAKVRPNSDRKYADMPNKHTKFRSDQVIVESIWRVDGKPTHCDRCSSRWSVWHAESAADTKQQALDLCYKCASNEVKQDPKRVMTSALPPIVKIVQPELAWGISPFFRQGNGCALYRSGRGYQLNEWFPVEVQSCTHPGIYWTLERDALFDYCFENELQENLPTQFDSSLSEFRWFPPSVSTSTDSSSSSSSSSLPSSSSSSSSYPSSSSSLPSSSSSSSSYPSLSSSLSSSSSSSSSSSPTLCSETKSSETDLVTVQIELLPPFMSALEGGDVLKLHIVPVIIPVTDLAKNADEKHTEMKQSQGSLTLEQIWKVTTPPTAATVEEKKARPLSSFNNRHSLETEALLGENRVPKPSLGDRIINFLEGFFKVAKIKYE